MDTWKTKFLYFSCPHYPLVDNEAKEWLLDRIKFHNPDVIIHGGDGHEADSASRWPSEYDWPLSHEFRTHNQFLKEVRLSNPESKRVFLPGNHDDNLLTLNRIDRKLRDLCDYRDHEPELAEWEQPCIYEYSNRGRYRIGQVTFSHGYEANQSADEMQSITLGIPYGLYVGGHTHRPKPVTQTPKTKAVPLPYWFANAGTIRDMDNVPYMSRKRRYAWGQAIVVGEAADWRYKDSLIPNSPLWEAETEVFRMYDAG